MSSAEVFDLFWSYDQMGSDQKKATRVSSDELKHRMYC